MVSPAYRAGKLPRQMWLKTHSSAVCPAGGAQAGGFGSAPACSWVGKKGLPAVPSPRLSASENPFRWSTATRPANDSLTPRHQVIRLRTGQPVAPFLACSSLGIDGGFDQGQQARRILNFVDQQRGGETLQEQCRIFPRQGQQHGVIQRDVAPGRFFITDFGAQGFEQGGFARLAGSGQHDHRKLSAGLHNRGLQTAGQVGHLISANVQLRCILAETNLDQITN
jgi:hypothetical protein